MFFTFELSHGKGLADSPRYFAGIELATDRFGQSESAVRRRSFIDRLKNMHLERESTNDSC